MTDTDTPPTRVVPAPERTLTIHVLPKLAAGQELDDLFWPQDVPEGEVWVRECIQFTKTNGSVCRVVMAYRGGPGLHLAVCTRSQMGDRWDLSTGHVSGPLRAAILFATGSDYSL